MKRVRKNKFSLKLSKWIKGAMTGSVVATGTLLSSPQVEAAPQKNSNDDNEKPNVIVMMVDNLGWGELGCYGGGMLRGAETPNLDKLAQEGIQCLGWHNRSLNIQDISMRVDRA